MFNDARFQEMLAAKVAEVVAGPEVWRATVGTRYGEFMARMAIAKIDAALRVIAQSDSIQARVHVAQEIAASAQVASCAAVLLGGDFTVSDPIRVETMMRVHAEATRC